MRWSATPMAAGAARCDAGAVSNAITLRRNGGESVRLDRWREQSAA
jgi:hypothetical protein